MGIPEFKTHCGHSVNGYKFCGPTTLFEQILEQLAVDLLCVAMGHS